MNYVVSALERICVVTVWGYYHFKYNYYTFEEFHLGLCNSSHDVAYHNKCVYILLNVDRKIKIIVVYS